MKIPYWFADVPKIFIRPKLEQTNFLCRNHGSKGKLQREFVCLCSCYLSGMATSAFAFPIIKIMSLLQAQLPPPTYLRSPLLFFNEFRIAASGSRFHPYFVIPLPSTFTFASAVITTALRRSLDRVLLIGSPYHNSLDTWSIRSILGWNIACIYTSDTCRIHILQTKDPVIPRFFC